MRIIIILVTLTSALQTRFKLARQLKATIGQGNKVALLEKPIIHGLQQEWSGPIRYSSSYTKNNDISLLQIQTNKVAYELLENTIPDHTDHDTVMNFARLTYDAYFEPTDKGWVPVPGWNVSSRFGWENTGIRGYLFEDETLTNLVIVIKGTSLATPIGSGPTARLDKLNVSWILSRII